MDQGSAEPRQPGGAADQSRRTISEAFQRLEAGLYPVDARHFRSWSLKDVQEAARVIQRDQEERRCIRNLRRIKPLFAALERLGGVVDTLCQGTPYLCFIWAPLKLILTIGNEYILGFEKLVDAYGQIAQHLPRMERLSKAFQEREEFQVIIGEVLADLLDFHLHAYKFLRRGGWKHLFDASWRAFAPRFDGILQSLARNRDLVDREANSLEILDAQRCRILLIRDIERREVDRRHQYFLATLNWLDLRGQDCDQENRLDDYVETRLNGTCEWVLDHPKVISWLAEDDHRPYLWIKGKPGAGKTTIAAHIIRQSPIPPKASVLFCLCTYGVGKENANFRSFMLRLLISQILRSNQDLVAFAYEEVANGNTPTDTRLRLLLRRLIGSLGRSYLVLDGLDECDGSEQKRVLKELLDLPVDDPSCELHRLKILICSRETTEILHMLAKVPCISLTDEQARVSKDIAIYTKAGLVGLKSNYENDLVNILEQQIISKADGMFLWARLVVSLAFEQKSIHELKNVVMRTPAGLDGIYASIVERLNSYPDEQRRKARSILGWVAFAFRTLKTFEICDLLIFENCGAKLDEETKLLKGVLDICKPLIEEKDDQTIVLVHFSAREYLVSTRSGPYLPAWSTNAKIAASSLRYLFTCLIFLAPASNRSAKYEILKGFHNPFPYVHEFWTQHYLAIISARPQSTYDISISEIITCLLRDFEAHWAAQSTSSLQRTVEELPSTSESNDEPLLEEGGHVLSSPRIEPSQLVGSYVRFCKRSPGKRLSAINPQERRIRDATKKNFETQEHDPTRLSEAYISFQSAFESLFLSSHASVFSELSAFNVTLADLESFHERHGGAPYRCSYRGCTEAAFKTMEARDKHESSHLVSLSCPEPSCDRVDDTFTRQALRKHILQYHSHSIDQPLQKFKIRRYKERVEPSGKGDQVRLPRTQSPVSSTTTSGPQPAPGRNQQFYRSESLTPEDNKAINLRAAQLAKATSKKEIRAIVDKMSPDLKQKLAQKTLDPAIYYFRMLATREFWQRQSKNRPELQHLADPQLSDRTQQPTGATNAPQSTPAMRYPSPYTPWLPRSQLNSTSKVDTVGTLHRSVSSERPPDLTDFSHAYTINTLTPVTESSNTTPQGVNANFPANEPGPSLHLEAEGMILREALETFGDKTGSKDLEELFSNSEQVDHQSRGFVAQKGTTYQPDENSATVFLQQSL